MVKILFFVMLFFSFSLADELDDKIRTFMSSNIYEKNRDYIKVLFSPKSSFYSKERINTIKVVQTLKENGLLNLAFSSPQELRLEFKSSGSPLFLVKLVSDSLRDIGYYRFVTESSTFDESEFTWSIVLTSENATDPTSLQRELSKKGCNIIDIKMQSLQKWSYVVDIQKGFFDVEKLSLGNALSLKRSLYSHWVNVINVQTLMIQSPSSNEWYPYIAFYDKSLHLLELIKKDEKQRELQIEVPRNAKYMKVSDLYTLKNIKEELSLQALEGR